MNTVSECANSDDNTKTNITLCTCANCGKEGSDSDMNVCNRCNSVKYCNHVRRSIDQNIKCQHLARDERYQSCCGKEICSGCFYANAKIDLKKQLCPFCRTSVHPSDDQKIQGSRGRDVRFTSRLYQGIRIMSSGCRTWAC